jgi:hypothetical protein
MLAVAERSNASEDYQTSRVRLLVREYTATLGIGNVSGEQLGQRALTHTSPNAQCLAGRAGACSHAAKDRSKGFQKIGPDSRRGRRLYEVASLNGCKRMWGTSSKNSMPCSIRKAPTGITPDERWDLALALNLP